MWGDSQLYQIKDDGVWDFIQQNRIVGARIAARRVVALSGRNGNWWGRKDGWQRSLVEVWAL